MYDNVTELIEMIKGYLKDKFPSSDQYVALAGTISGVLTMLPDTKENREFIARCIERYSQAADDIKFIKQQKEKKQ